MRAWVCECERFFSVFVCVGVYVFACVYVRLCVHVRANARVCVCVSCMQTCLLVCMWLVDPMDSKPGGVRSRLLFFWLFCLRLLSATTQAPVFTTGRCDSKTFSTLYFSSHFFNALPTHFQRWKKKKKVLWDELKKSTTTRFLNMLLLLNIGRRINVAMACVLWFALYSSVQFCTGCWTVSSLLLVKK